MDSENLSIRLKNSQAAIICGPGGNVSTGDIYMDGPPQKKIKINDFHLPPTLDTFKGRDKILKHLESLFFEKDIKKIVICGLPGFGKSALAAQFGRQCLDNEQVKYVFWIKAEQREDIIQSFKGILKTYQIPEVDEGSLIKYIYDYFKTDNSLFIFDNVVCRKTIAQLEPPNNFHFLITSQERDWDNDIKSILLKELLPADAVQVIIAVLKQHYNSQDFSLYESLAKIIGNIPLALQISAACVRQSIINQRHHFNLKKYVEEIRDSYNKYMNMEIPRWSNNDYEKSLYGTVKITLEKISEDTNLREVALNALYSCAYLHPEYIGFEDLLCIDELIKKQNNQEEVLMAALTLLDNYAIINYSYDRSKIKIHRFIQKILLYHLHEFDQQTNIKCYRACMESTFSDSEDDDNISSSSSEDDSSSEDASSSNEDTSSSSSSTIYIDDDKVYDLHNDSIFEHADTNLLIFWEYYEKHKRHFLKDPVKNNWKFEIVLKSLVKCACTESLNKIFQDIGCLAKECVIVFDLLHCAAACNQVSTLELLLKYDNNINRQDKDQNSPLHIAASEGNINTIKFLLNHNADLDAMNDVGNIPLFEFIRAEEISYSDTYNIKSCMYELNEILELLQCYKNVNTTNDYCESLLHVGAAQFNEILVNDFINVYKLEVNKLDIKGRTPLHSLIYQLIETDRNINEEAGSTAMVLRLFGANLNIKDSDGMSPIELIQREKLNYVEIFLYLDDKFENEFSSVLEHLGDRDRISKYIKQLNLLYYAVRHNYAKILKLLLQYNVDINFKDENRNTILHWASFAGYLEIIKILTQEHKADLNVINICGDTPLLQYFAGAYFWKELNSDNISQILSMLTQEDIKNITKENGETLLHVGITTFNIPLINTLISKFHIEINKQDSIGRTALHTFIYNLKEDNIKNKEEASETARILKENGASLKIRDKSGMTPLKLAKQRKLDYIVSILKE